jgi:DNA polymerase I-like protein with 3'-5' exonuclease and polymerase domains
MLDFLDIDRIIPQWQKDQGVDYKLVTNLDDLDDFLDRIPEFAKVALDTETNSLDTDIAKLVGFSLSYAEKQAIYVPVEHSVGIELNLGLEHAARAIHKLVKKHTILVYSRFDLAIIENTCGLEFGEYPFEDVLLSVYLYDSNEKSKKLKFMAKKHLHIDMLSFADITTLEISHMQEDLNKLRAQYIVQREGRKPIVTFPKDVGEYYKKRKAEIAGLKKSAKGLNTFDLVHPKAALYYAAADADIALRLYNYTANARVQQPAIYKIESALINVIRQQENDRVRIDVEYLRSLETKLLEDKRIASEAVYKHAGRSDFDIDSPQQLGKVLYEELGLRYIDPFQDNARIIPLTEKGKYSTDSTYLNGMRLEYPIVQAILDYRSVVKALSTYVLPLMVGLNSENDAKFNFNQYAAPTGRLSVSSSSEKKGSKGKIIRSGAYMDYNIHSVPKNYGKSVRWCAITNSQVVSELHVRSFEGKTLCLGQEEKKCSVCSELDIVQFGFFDVSGKLNIRKAFRAREGFKLLTIDYSQIELRIAAALSREPIWLNAYKENRDLHEEMARTMFDGNIDKEHRSLAKTSNFNNLFGGGPKSLAEASGLSAEKAKRIHTLWLAAVPTYVNWTKAKIAFAKKYHYIKTEFGRIRPVPEKWFSDPKFKFFAEHVAVNSPIQGSAADILKATLVRVNQKIKELGLRDDIKILYNVHDEVVFEVREGRVLELEPVLVQVMELDIQSWRPVKITVNSEVGNNWGESVPLEYYSKIMYNNSGGSNNSEKMIPKLHLDITQSVQQSLQKYATGPVQQAELNGYLVELPQRLIDHLLLQEFELSESIAADKYVHIAHV